LRNRPRLTNSDRWFFIQLYRWFPSILQVLTMIRPETLVRWHRAGFRYYWRWKSRSLGGRPQIETDLRGLIRRMSIENPLWGAPRIHGELLKLGPDPLGHKRSLADYITTTPAVTIYLARRTAENRGRKQSYTRKQFKAVRDVPPANK
jgi:hypothetical protein